MRSGEGTDLSGSGTWGSGWAERAELGPRGRGFESPEESWVEGGAELGRRGLGVNSERKRVLSENMPSPGDWRYQRLRVEVTVGQLSRKRGRRNLSVRSIEGSCVSGMSPSCWVRLAPSGWDFEDWVWSRV